MKSTPRPPDRNDVRIATEHANAVLWRIRDLVATGRPLQSAKDEALAGMDVTLLTWPQRDALRAIVDDLDFKDVRGPSLSAGAASALDAEERRLKRSIPGWKRLVFHCTGILLRF